MSSQVKTPLWFSSFPPSHTSELLSEYIEIKDVMKSFSSAECMERTSLSKFPQLITEEGERAFVSAMLRDFYFSTLWTEAKVHRFDDGEVNFVFEDGTQILYLAWDINQPDLTNGGCISVSGENGHSGLYTIIDCGNTTNYICEYDRQAYPTPSPTPTPTPGEVCLEDWNYFAGQCYQIFPNAVSWTDGERRCQAYGGHLASINSINEQKAILQIISSSANMSYSNSLWVGLQFNSEMDEHWTDGSSISFLNWAKNQPDIHEHENCISCDKSSLKMSCSVCESHLPYICQVKEGEMMSTISPPPTMTPPPKCDDGEGDWYLFKDYCYKFVSAVQEDPLSWELSNKKCRDEGAYLASVGDIMENVFFESMIYEMSDEALWLGGRSRIDSEFEWIDGTGFAFDHWDDGEPNNYLEQEDCIEIYTSRMGKWNDRNCGHSNGRICKRPHGSTLSTPKPTTPPEGNCPQGWVTISASGRCMKFVANEVEFINATRACKELHPRANLASIHSSIELAYITAAIGMMKIDAWIGLKFEEGEYVWVDQTTTDYTPWGPGEPSGESTEGACVQAAYPEGLMYAVPCSDRFGYICTMDQDPSITEPSELPRCDEPHENYFRYNDDCYELISTPKTWKESEKSCLENGGHLASAFTINENAFMWILTRDGQQLQHPWIGFNNLQESHKYEWVDGWPVFYTHWGEDQPLVNSTDYNCVWLDYDNGQWYNAKCYEEKTFLCRYSKDAPPSPEPIVPGHCIDDSWMDVQGGYCYLLVQEEKTWSEASTYCELLDSSLTSIHSDGETELLFHTISGLRSNIWIGLIQRSSGFGWIDKTPVDYVNWHNDQPSSDDEQCTEFYLEDGTWNDAFCHDSVKPFVCKAKKIPDVEPTKTTLSPITTSSPGGTGRLSGGAIFGIVAGVLVAVGVIGLVGYSRNRKKLNSYQRQKDVNPIAMRFQEGEADA